MLVWIYSKKRNEGKNMNVQSRLKLIIKDVIMLAFDRLEYTSGHTIEELSRDDQTRPVKVDVVVMREVINLLRTYFNYTSMNDLAESMDVSTNTIFYGLKNEEDEWTAILTRKVIIWLQHRLEDLI